MSELLPPLRIQNELVVCLADLTSVRKIASFGSIAEDRADVWSDVDLLVACEDLKQVPWMAAAAIRAAKPVTFYRMFSTANQPSGRYYFEGESPFNKLDISFCSQAEFDAICREKRIGPHVIVPDLLYVADQVASVEADLTKRAPWNPVTITEWETEAGRLLYVHLEAVKARLRGRVAKQSGEEIRADLLRMLSNSYQTAGGNWATLAQQCVCL